MMDKIINELKSSTTKINFESDSGCESINIETDKGMMWIKKPCEGRILVHFVKEYESEDKVLELLKSMNKHM